MKKVSKNSNSSEKNKTVKRKTPHLLAKKLTLKSRRLSVKPTTKAKKHESTLEKPKHNPIIAPRAEHDWEAWQTFNPGVIILDGQIHFIYRAIGIDGLSRFGYAASNDGFTIEERSAKAVYEHAMVSATPNFYSFASGGSFGGAEDPRLVQVGKESKIYMTYTAVDGGLRVGLTSIDKKDFLNKKWKWKVPVLISPAGETNKNWVIFPEKINGKYAILHAIAPKILIAYVDSLDNIPRIQSSPNHGGRGYQNPNGKKTWDSFVRGVGAPPIKTEHGWLVFYHAIDETDPGKYKVGAMLLDLKDPTHIICRSKQPIIEPEEHYENNGAKYGIVYASGAVVKDGRLMIYYGGSDNYVCIAHANLEQFLDALRKDVEPKVSLQIDKKKNK